MATRVGKKANEKTARGIATRNMRPAVIPVIQEQAKVFKRTVETGKVRISKKVREYDEVVDVPHFQEEVKVERVPINKMIESAPSVRTEGDVTIIPVVEERYVMEKKLVLVEELHVRKDRKESHHPQTLKVLKEEVEVERIPPGQQRATRARAAKPR